MPIIRDCRFTKPGLGAQDRELGHQNQVIELLGCKIIIDKRAGQARRPLGKFGAGFWCQLVPTPSLA